MKLKSILSLVILMCSLHIIDAQRIACSTEHNDVFMSRLESNVKNATPLKAKVPRFIPVALHIVSDNNGNNTITDDEIIDKMCVLNNRYADIEMHFYIAEINRINNTSLNHMPRLSSSVSLIRSSKNRNAMNIFLVNEILQNDGSPSGAAGYYSGGSNNDFIIMLQSTPGDDSYTMEHEIGHFFSLAHTHVGWEGDISQGSSSGGYDPAIHGDTVRITTITGSTQAPDTAVELVNGSNCTTAGDRICDTPPDYGFGQACSCCTMQWDVWDRNGDKIEPMMDNVMSYSNGCNEYYFTDGQRDAMYADFDSGFRSYLRVNEVTEYTPLTSPVSITSPQDNDIFESFDGVLIEWEALENAEYYKVNISGTQQFTFETTDTELYIEELRPESFYFVDVEAFNIFGTGCQQSTRKIFSTGTGSTATNETTSITNLNIFPNPVSAQQDLRVEYTADKNIDATFRLLNIQGQVILLNNTTFAAGKNNFKVKTESLASGLYILEINTPEGIISEKIIIK